MGTCWARPGHADAEREHREALSIRQGVQPPLPAELAQSYHNLADLAWPQGHFLEGRRLAESALSIRERIYPAGHPRISSTLNCLANFYWAEGDYDRAQALNERALAAYEKTLGRLSQEAGWSLRNLAQIDLSRGNVTAALERLDRWLRIGELLLSSVHSEQQAGAKQVLLDRGLLRLQR